MCQSAPSNAEERQYTRRVVERKRLSLCLTHRVIKQYEVKEPCCVICV